MTPQPHPPVGGEDDRMPMIDERRPLIQQDIPNYTEDSDLDSDDGTRDAATNDDDQRSTTTEATLLGSIVGTVTDTVDHIMEGTTDLVEGVSDAFYEIADEVMDAKEIFVDELHEADDGDLFFLDMSLMRNLSILPSDVTAVADHGSIAVIDGHGQEEDADEVVAGEATIPGGDDDEKKPAQDTGIPCYAYFLLALAVTSLSSIGPLLDLQQDTTGSTKLYWRMMGTAILLFPFAAYDVYHYGMPKMTSATWIIFMASTFFYDIMVLGFVLALGYTTVGNAVILSNSQALILLVGKIFVGSPVVWMEGIGAIVAFSGAVLCSRDSAEGSSDMSGALWGDFLAVVAAIGGVGYLVFAKTSRHHMSLYVFMFLTMFIGSLLIIPFQILVMRETISLGFDRENGLWGFLTLSMDRLPLELCMVVVCNCMGTLGYVRSLSYFDSIVIATAGLMEPVIAELMSFSFGISDLPGWKGWLGNALVAGGTIAVVYPASQGGHSTGAH